MRNNLNKIVKASFGGKIEKKAADYRLSLIHVVNNLIKNNPTSEVRVIFETLLNIQHLLYMSSNERTNTTVLKLHACLFKHCLAIKKLVGKTPKNTKFYGKYFHALTRHSPDYYRIVAGSTLHTEKEERTFTKVKAHTNNSSNRHAQHIINNVFVRTAVDNRAKRVATRRLESKISKEYQELQEKPSNTFVSFKTIEKYPFQYQAFLESIADFLIEGNAFWEETNNGVVFFDTVPSQNVSTKTLHHFRSFTAKKEEDYVKECWVKCLENPNSLIPAIKIKANDEGLIQHLGSLNYFNVSNVEINSDIPNQSIVSFSLAPIENNLNLTPIVNDIGALDMDASSIISTNEKQDSSFLINTSPLKSPLISSAGPSRMSSTPMAPCKLFSNKHKVIPSTKKHQEEILEVVPVVEQLPAAKNYGNSALMLIELFGEKEEISLFDESKKKLKSLARSKVKPHVQLQLKYEKVISHFEVILKNKKEKLLDKVKYIELNSIKNNKCSSLVPTDILGAESYSSLKKHLRYIDSLQREFKL